MNDNINIGPDPELERLILEEEEIDFERNMLHLADKANGQAIRAQLAFVTKWVNSSNYVNAQVELRTLQDLLNLRISIDQLIREQSS